MKKYVVVKKYVVGFMFDDSMEKVVMIRKNRPDWQKGLLNGVGGGILPGECSLHAMMREFEEETGVKTIASTWAHVCTLRFPYAEVEFFAAKNSRCVGVARTTTDEEIGFFWVGTNRLMQSAITGNPSRIAIDNIPALLELSKQRLRAGI